MNMTGRLRCQYMHIRVGLNLPSFYVFIVFGIFDGFAFDFDPGFRKGFFYRFFARFNGF